jgi:hypothetical protein
MKFNKPFLKNPLFVHVTKRTRVVKAFLIAKYFVHIPSTFMLLVFYLRVHRETNGDIATLVPYIMFIIIWILVDKTLQSLFVVKLDKENIEDEFKNANRHIHSINVVPFNTARAIHQQTEEIHNAIGKTGYCEECPCDKCKQARTKANSNTMAG